MNSFILTAQSAWSTLLICDKQARKDWNTVYQIGQSVYAFLSSDDAIRTYKTIYRAIELACLCTIYLGSLFREWTDNLVAECEKPNGEVATIDEVVEEVIAIATQSAIEAVRVIAPIVKQAIAEIDVEALVDHSAWAIAFIASRITPGSSTSSAS